MDKRNSWGFTLIEIMVVVTVSMVMVGMGLAQYNQFKDKQGLLRSANKFATDLREVQQRADIGKRENCVGKDVELTEYRVELNGTDLTSAKITEGCDHPINPPSSTEVGLLHLPDGITFENPSFSITFPVLSQNTASSGSIELKSVTGAWCVPVMVDNGRDISVGDLGSC